MDNFLLALLKMLRADSADIATAAGLQEMAITMRAALLDIQKIVLDIEEGVQRLRQVTPREIFTITEELKMVLSVETAKLSAKMDELNTKLEAASARDAVQVQLAVDMRAQIEALKGTVVALPVDTTEAEAAIDAVIAKMDASGAKLDALDAAPAAAEPAPASPVETPPVVAAPATPVAEAPTEPTPADTAPASPEPAATVSDAPVAADSATKVDANS